MKLLGWFFFACLVFGGIWFFTALPRDPITFAAPAAQAGVPAVTEACAGKRNELATYLDKAKVQRSGDRFLVDELLWATLSHDQKVNLAIAAFCQVAQNGSGTVVIAGYHDGKAKAHVVDGNYLD